jgi:hypothetical protein
MSNYTITTDFGAKDSLPSSNDSKVVRGSEFTTEFTSIQTAIATKADTAGDTFTGVVNFSADVAVNTNTLFVDVSEAKVGIGTTSPARALHVSSGATNEVARFESTDTACLVEFKDSTGTASIETRNDFRFSAGGSERMRIDSSGNVGIGTNLPGTKLHVDAGTDQIAATFHSTDAGSYINITDSGSGTYGAMIGAISDEMVFSPNNVEAMRIDSSGRLLVGTTDTSVYDSASGGNTGFVYSPNHLLQVARETTTSTQSVMNLNKMGVDGNIIELYKDGSNVGNIGTEGGRPYLASSTLGIRVSNALFPCNTSGVITDGACNIGSASGRFEDLYLSGGVHLGGTGSANKLDDYEEGTWTPNLYGNTTGSASPLSYSAASTQYTKVGRLIYFNAYITNVQAANHSKTGEFRISGLPFAASRHAPITVSYTDLFTFDDADISVSGYVSNGSTYISIRKGSSKGAVFATELTNNNLSDIMISGSYTTT